MTQPPGMPYVCIIACQALPLLREALTAGLISSLPLLTDDQARERGRASDYQGAFARGVGGGLLPALGCVKETGQLRTWVDHL